ncbi:hypothetical protein J27TS8_44090 [Robertmurraya siralis]|uniref:Uncharacterized protein n=1 Tax=Robertmurraya siralis TaxID=77777 RepID=A0A920BWE5_9BACI|nr:hypothetical protein [Robertmurraya siralis]PAE22415.1 hypothetical protein CHH80_00165 [Bacillus sp. 7504-2]GIN64416.1 hypothetical protein J27TS8_44090 [Robertmurraya siralis]
MKKEVLVVIFALFFMSITAITGAYAIDESEKMETIVEEHEDLTGDGKDENILVKGEVMDDESGLYKRFLIEVVDNQGGKHQIELEEGVNLYLTFQDLNQDGIKDMLVSVSNSGSGDITNHYLYALKDDRITDLTVPDPLIIQSQFLNGYKAKINIDNNHKSHKFNLKNRAEDYENAGLYYNGILNEPTELMVQSYSKLEPVKLKGSKLGLKGVQTISGAHQGDVIANIESTWEYKSGEWALVSTKVIETPYIKKEQ